jgi:hypothetical protein
VKPDHPAGGHGKQDVYEVFFVGLCKNGGLMLAKTYGIPASWILKVVIRNCDFVIFKVVNQRLIISFEGPFLDQII